MRNSAGLGWMLMASAVLAGPATMARADDEDPGRGVARISVINGDVSVRRGDSGDWVAAAVNAPLVVQDTISTGPNSHAEVQFDYANMLRLGSNAEVRLSELENRRYQMQVARGTVEFRVLRNSDADVDVSTPAVSVRPRKKGAYRVFVRDDGEVEVTVRSGEVEIYTPRGVERLGSGHSMLVRNGANGPEFQTASAAPYDEFDRWNEQRDRALERTGSYRYVSPQIYGADELDGYGRWVYDAPYGWVWVPSMGPGWAPYRAGRWVWEDWYGWTWVSYDPWGWAPYHWGRWYHGRMGWCWYPGGFHERHYWRPALVAFFGFGGGGVGVGFGFGHVGWVPLAPHEPYYPWYGRGYYGGYRGGYVDRSVHVTNVNIVNVYRNARGHDGISGLDAGSFGRGQGNIARVSAEQIRTAGLVRGQLPVAPSHESLRYANHDARYTPRADANTRFFSRRQPTTVDRVSFAEQQRSFDPRAQRGAAQGVTAQPGRVVQPAEAGARNNGGWRQAGTAAQPAAGAQTPAVRDNGWRRTGDPTAAPKAAQPGEAVRRNEPADRGNANWRRFGDQSPRQAETPASGAVQRSGEQQVQRNQPADRGNANWRRFGDQSPRQAETPASGAVQRSGEQQVQRNQPADRGNANWRRFGDQSPRQAETPASGAVQRSGEQQVQRNQDRGNGNSRRSAEPSQQRQADAPARQSEPARRSEPAQQNAQPKSGDTVRRNESSDRGRRFGEPGAQSFSAPRSQQQSGNGWQRFENAQPRQTQAPSYSRPGRQESMQISPPVVRERSTPRSESYSRSGAGASPRTESAPRVERSGGGESRGGGNGHVSREGGRSGRTR